MIKFDSNAIYNRIVDKLQQDPNWKVIVNNSIVSAIIKSNAEANAETARYAEYLFKESRWDTAQNHSSILSMANMLGYQPKRKISARGKLYVSLSPLTHAVGKTISYDSFLQLKDGVVTNATNGFIKNTGTGIDINSSSTVTCGNKNFIVTNASTLEQNHYITSIDVMEGVKQTEIIDFNTLVNIATISKLDPYLYIPLTINDCEDASNLSSIPFLKVYVGYKSKNSNGDEAIRYKEYRVVDNLLLSSPDDYDCEFYNDLYNQNLFYLKFNNDLYNSNCLDLSHNSSIEHIRIDYVKSSGDAGNINDLFSEFRLETSNGHDGKVTLYGINYTAINGGADEENVNDIKRNTIKAYTKYFSIGTKEAYEKAIANTEFKITTIGSIKPKKVHVYGDYHTSDDGTKQLVTYVSFIGSGLEDLGYASVKTNPYEEVEQALNYYLTRLKSPQDIIKFTPPEYVSFSVGANCTVVNSSEYELKALQTAISDYIDSLWGPNSDNIDFGNNFYTSQLQSQIKSAFTDVVSVNLTVEAVKKLKWNDAVILTPKNDDNGIIHTCRIPFNFSSVFLGDTKINPGFKDHRDGAQYLMRIDIMYKKPQNYSGVSVDYHKSIFVKENRNRSVDRTGFYTVQTIDPIVWSDRQDASDIATRSEDYLELADVDKLDKCYQVDYEPKVFNDNAFISLENEIKSGVKTTRSASTSVGAMDNYIIYFSGSYNKDSSKIGYGWLEFTFDDLYSVLTYFSLYDSELSSDLMQCPLASLKCGVANDSVFNKFKEIVSKYVDIYVSMRPIKTDLSLTSISDTNKYGSSKSNEVLYIDSYDTQILDNINNASNLTLDKKARFIDVKCSYEDV